MTHHADAVALIHALQQGQPAHVGFVWPIVSTMLAAERLHPTYRAAPTFDPDAKRYADHGGLLDALEERFTNHPRTGLVGKKYSPLARLVHDTDVEIADDTVTACLHANFGEELRATVNEICRVIGELHDNVASHARGAGFSALQVYQGKPSAIVEFAVCDAGVGLLRNVMRVEPTVTTHQAAVHWCFQKGNTTARSPVDDISQRLPDDAPMNPYPKHIPTRSTENHHLGEGLWQLLRLVVEIGGTLWALTGDAELEVTPANPAGTYTRSKLDWHGLAIEVSLPVGSIYASQPKAGDESIAWRFGI